ncbi:MAG: hypothetical protein Q7K42_04160, partial [Candidatus Diapherotrites archaeon]|nr:hypothetical protein [Candidatus Diapherotrites archaeon]
MVLMHEDLKKKVIIFGFEDILVPGTVQSQVDQNSVREILSNLKELEKKFSDFHLVLVSGLQKKLFDEKILEFGLLDYFKPENVFNVTPEYIKTKSKDDKFVYNKNLSKDPRFKDEYFKQIIINELKIKFSCSLEEMVFVCHDVWSEAYYTCRYGKIDIALIKSSLSKLGEQFEMQIPGLIYIDLAWTDVEKILKWQSLSN